jgi:hypothetical protein
MPNMARTVTAVQLASFKGIYTMAGEPPVFTPGPLVFTNPNKVDGNEFANTRGKTFIVVNNKSADASIVLTLDATASVAENPSSLPVVDPVITIPFGEANIIGPFTGNFEKTGGNINIDWSGAAVNTDVDIAVVKLP